MGSRTHTFSWMRKAPFHFESDGTLEDVIRALEKKDGDDTNAVDDRMRIERLRDGVTFQFHYERRYPSNNRFETTAFAHGTVWQDETGRVIVEGEAYVDSNLYVSVGIFIALAIVSGIATGGFWGFSLAIFAVAAFMVSVYDEDRIDVITALSEAVTSTTKPSKMPLQKSKKKISPRSSVWNEAVSEYRERGHRDE